MSAGLLVQFYLVEPDGQLHDDDAAHNESRYGDADKKIEEKEQKLQVAETKPENETTESDNPFKPTKMNWNLLYIIILGSVLDNIGSMGPLMGMSPVSYHLTT